jgi:outer membrane protein assembly factor BamB
MHDGVSDIDRFQGFITSGDTSLTMYLSLDGPMRIDLRTGATLWRGQALAGQPVPSVGDYPRMHLVDSTLVIPRDKGLVGVDARSGQVRWQNDTLLPRRATLLAAVPAGILIRAGTDYANVLDPATGTFRWSRPITLRTDGAGPYIFRTDGGAFTIVENRYYFVSRDRFMVTDLATGDTTGSEKLRFKDTEWASRVFRVGDGFVVISRQNLFRVDARGALRYQRFYNAPGTSFLQQMGGMYGTYGSAAVDGQYAYFVTNQPDSAGRKGNSLLRVALDDGSEAGRVWLRVKAPTYWLDSPRDHVLMLADDRTLVAVRFGSKR